ncbi:MAG: DUF1028 domain-containing protein [Bacteroidota bacterium]
MIHFLRTFFMVVSLGSFSLAQDTFSIVAADSSTREVGSAGASCVDLFTFGYTDPSFLGDLVPNMGAINSQASYLPANQNNARSRMLAGDSPSAIVNWLMANDAQSNPQVRQYGIVGFNGLTTSASGFTGTNCMNYKNHITGSINGIYYSIQGNILLGQNILDSMEFMFRNASGDLSCRLMAALQGAKVVGADTRCAVYGTSSLFAFLKVSQPTDAYNNPSFKIGVRTSGGTNIEPIDSLQTLFNAQKNCGNASIHLPSGVNPINIFPNPSSGDFTLKLPTESGSMYVVDMLGRLIVKSSIEAGMTSFSIDQPGIYMVTVSTNLGTWVQKIMVNAP